MFLSQYDNWTIYKFIAEELFEHKILGTAGVITGMVTHFTYEELQSNHSYDINKCEGIFVKLVWEKVQRV